MNYNEQALELHQKHGGKLESTVVSPINNKEDLSVVYTPGVAAVSRLVAEDESAAYTHTIKGRTVAVISDGSAVLGLGNIGPLGALPVMEGKCALLKEFANVDAWPIVLDTQDSQEIIETVRRISPGFGGINLEDISAPRCFEIEAALQDLGIPVFHDDQHGTAMVVLAGLINAAQVVGKDLSSMKVVMAGAGAAGTAIMKILLADADQAPADVVMCDSKGIIHSARENLNAHKSEIASITNKSGQQGSLSDALVGADVFIGVSAPNTVTVEMVRSMNEKAIIFAMANPDPEIMPDIARAAGAAVIATGRSDFPNQVNNVLVFPGIFRGALDNRVTAITTDMKLAAARALAGMVTNPTADQILPDPFDPEVVPTIAAVVK